MFQRPDGTVPLQYTPRVNPYGTAGSNITGAGYAAQIAKTTDGGASWTTVFNVSNQFYVRGYRRAVVTARTTPSESERV